MLGKGDRSPKGTVGSNLPGGWQLHHFLVHEHQVGLSPLGFAYQWNLVRGNQLASSLEWGWGMGGNAGSCVHLTNVSTQWQQQAVGL